jgi:chromosome partitioning protein
MSIFERLRTSHRGDSGGSPGGALPVDGADDRLIAEEEVAQDVPPTDHQSGGHPAPAAQQEEARSSPDVSEAGGDEGAEDRVEAAPRPTGNGGSWGGDGGLTAGECPHQTGPDHGVDTPPGGVPTVNTGTDRAWPSSWRASDVQSAANDSSPDPWAPGPSGSDDSGDGVTTPGQGSPAAAAHLSPPDTFTLADAEPEEGLDPSLSSTGGDVPAAHGALGDGHPGAGRALPRIMAIANQKGGVGKTTTAVNLGAALAELGYRVLVIDLDPQGNATTGLGVNPRNLDNSIYDVVLHEVPIEDCIEPSGLRNLFVVPATIDLAGAEIELVPLFSRELRLRRALEPALSDFDYMLIDCPPSLGLLTVNGLAAAHEVVVPIQCEYYALEGLGQLLRNVNLVKTNLNPALELSTVILTMFDARTRLAEQVVDEVRDHFGDRVCRNVVPRTVRLSEAPSFGQPIIVFDSSSRGAIAYRELAKEVSGGAPQRVG